jgi:hypothetical protein
MLFKVAVIIFSSYIIFSLAITYFVKKRSSKPNEWKYVALFFVLLPVWNILIALILYIPSTIFWAGDTIREKVKTDIIHYDIYNEQKGAKQHSRIPFFYKGINYAETEIKQGMEKGLYRYRINENGDIKREKISEISARYTIREKAPLWLYVIPIKFMRLDIIDRQQNKIIASGKRVEMSLLSFFNIPIYSWIYWHKPYLRTNKDYYNIYKEVINSD